MKKILGIILIFTGFLSFGQENRIVTIDKEVNSIDSDSTLTKSEFDLIKNPDVKAYNNNVLKVWHKKNQIFKIVEKNNTDYGFTSSTIYLNGLNPIKIIESESVYTILPDSISKIKGFSIDLIEEFKATSYIINWNKKERELVIEGKPSDEEKLSFEFIKYNSIIRKTKNLINQ